MSSRSCAVWVVATDWESGVCRIRSSSSAKPGRGVLDRVERLCAGGLDAKALREQLLAEVPGLSWGELPRLVRSRYLSQGTRWTDLIEAGALVRSLCAATDGGRT